MVLDEAQAIKNSLSRTAKATRRLRAAHRVALTGTPVENRLAELWSIMDFLNPGMLGSSELFRARYAIPVERHGATEPAERLRAITRPYILRRLKTDPAIIDDLPEKIEMKEYCQLTVEQASLYQSIVDDMMEKIENSEGIERRGNVLAAMAKLKQVCNHPAQVLHDRSPVGSRSGKVIRLEELLEEILAEGDRVLCFTQFTEFAAMLLPHLAARFGTDVAYLHGGTPKTRRDEMVERFQSGHGPPIFLLSLKAGGTGLNLTAANHVIHLDRWWNPAVENQATDRAFRIGQTAQRAGAQVRLHRHPGGEDRPDDRGQEGAGRSGRRRRRGLAHRAVHAASCARCSPCPTGPSVSRCLPAVDGRAPVEGGLKARSTRGAIAQTWWSERFIAVLEDIGMGSRLQRGRSYARKGQVISLEVDAGSVTAQVQGSRATPVPGADRPAAPSAKPSGPAWSASSRATPGICAKLLAGEMPDDIEDVFAGVGLSLFPASAGELSLDCSCPDWEVPCKHLAATFYLLAESFDDDPFRILAWRGRQREDLLDNLHAARTDGPPAADSTEHRGVPLADCLAQLLRGAGRPSEAEPAGHLQHLPAGPAATDRRHAAWKPADGAAATRLPSLRELSWQDRPRAGCRSDGEGCSARGLILPGQVDRARPLLRARRCVAEFAEYVWQLRTTHKRKRAFMAALDIVSIPDREGRRARRRR